MACLNVQVEKVEQGDLTTNGRSKDAVFYKLALQSMVPKKRKEFTRYTKDVQLQDNGFVAHSVACSKPMDDRS
jgi:hypothetical protein